MTFESPCECRGNHGVARWEAKTDPALPPQDSGAIKPITPAEIYNWRGPGGNVPRGGGRIPAEQQWYAVTGRVEKVRAEDDGDLHIVLENADNRPGKVVVEVPLGEPWCQVRALVFSWTDASFPFTTGRAPFQLTQHPVVTAIGRAFYDTDHAGDTRDNKRSYQSGAALWEIHPVMALRSATSSELAASNKRPVPEVVQPTATTTPAPQAKPLQPAADAVTVIITKPVTIRIPYGNTTLQPGLKVEVVARDADTVTVKYMGGNYAVPVNSTDFR